MKKENIEMKKLAVLGLGLCVALSFSSCKSSESAYKKAYEKAKQKELAEAQTTAPAEEAVPVSNTTPVVAAPVETARVVGYGGNRRRKRLEKLQRSMWQLWRKG